MVNKTLDELFPLRMQPSAGTKTGGINDALDKVIQQELEGNGAGELEAELRRATLEEILERKRLRKAESENKRLSLTSGNPAAEPPAQREPVSDTVVTTLLKDGIKAITDHNKNLMDHVLNQAKQVTAGETVSIKAQPEPQLKQKTKREELEEEVNFIDGLLDFAQRYGHGKAVSGTTSAVVSSPPQGADPIAWLNVQKEMLQMQLNHQESMHKLSREEAARDLNMQLEIAKISGNRNKIREIRGLIGEVTDQVGSVIVGGLKSKAKEATKGEFLECPDCKEKTIYRPHGVKGPAYCSKCGSGYDIEVKTP